ncbi:neprilysin-2-like isoform X2 [Babylonia areolata]|uniref:neprilysin-2-like isoform X2 n=1 Tax=Babylonia areolata TaxID=304850 RepID=UPI003FCFA3EF
MPGPQDNQVGPADPDLPPPPSQAEAGGGTTPAPAATTDPENPDPPLQQPPPRQPPQEGGCCKNRSLLEKCLLWFLLIVFLLFIAFLIGFLILYFWRDDPKKYCTDDNCVEAAAKMHLYIDEKADPCVDFYQYACGKWIKSSIIPEDQPEVTIYSQMEDNTRALLKKRLEEESNYLETKAVQKTRDFYASCIDDDTLDSLGSEPFEKLAAMIGKWPSLDGTWNETDFELEETLLSLSRTRDFSTLPLLAPEIKPDFENPSVRVVYIGEGQLGMQNASREAYVKKRNGKELQAYQTMLQKMLVELGADQEDAKTDAKDVVDFEVQLANISMTKEQRENSLFEVTSIDDLEDKYPEFDWVNFINGLVQYGAAPPQITSADRIVLSSPTYLKKLFPLLEKTSDRVKANYLMSSLWRHTAHISEPFRKIIVEYYKDLKGVEPRQSRWEACVKLTDDLFPETTGRLFVQGTFDQKQQDNINKLVDSLRKVFVDILRQTEWMTSGSKKVAVEKAKALKTRIGYPKVVLKDEKLDEMYSEYNMSRETFFENTIRVAYLKNSELVSKLRKTVDEEEWSFSAATVKAYYDPKSNELVFPAGMVQPPVYDMSYPRSMNYGGLGSFIAREMTHGFDDTGRYYDKDGQARQSWWTDSDMANYEKQTECMENHYSCFRWKPARMNIDGLRTLRENIADNGGLKQSYRAYRHWVEQRGIEEHLLPGLNLTHNQLFFISFAQLWCTNDRDDYKIHKILTDSFAPAPFRVKGTLQNSMDFAEAFNCPEGSAMNPKAKCKVW